MAGEGRMPSASAASHTSEARDGRPAHARSSCTYGAAELMRVRVRARVGVRARVRVRVRVRV